MRFTTLSGILLVILSTGPRVCAQAEISTPASKPRFLVVHKSNVDEFVDDLRLLSMQGYKVIALSHGRREVDNGETMTLEKVPEGAPTPEYMMASTAYLAGDLENEINRLSDNGFRVVPEGVFTGSEVEKTPFLFDFLDAMLRSDHHFERSTVRVKRYHVLMERGSDRLTACHYLVPSSRFDLQDKKAKRAVAEGRRMVGATDGEALFIGNATNFVMERCAANIDELAKLKTQPVTGALKKLYRVINTNDRARAQKDLDKAVSQGYSILFSSRGMLALEQTARPAIPREYRVVTATDSSTLEQALNAANDFCMVPDTMSVTENARPRSRRIFAVLERSPGGAGCHYRVLTDRDHTIPPLQNEVNAAADQGYRVRGVTDDQMATTVIMESPVREEAGSRP